MPTIVTVDIPYLYPIYIAYLKPLEVIKYRLFKFIFIEL